MIGLRRLLRIFISNRQVFFLLKMWLIFYYYYFENNMKLYTLKTAHLLTNKIKTNYISHNTFNIQRNMHYTNYLVLSPIHTLLVPIAVVINIIDFLISFYKGSSFII
jgi:hypothetical protein